MEYFIYIIRCEDDKLYTGITTDYKRRFLEHKSGVRGAKWTKAFKPQKIEVLYKTDGRSNALKLESKIKKLKKADKENLCSDKRSFKKYFKDIIDVNIYKFVRVKF